VGPFSTSKKFRGTKAQGIRFERDVAKDLFYELSGSVLLNQWIEYRDLNGHGWAQPDAIWLDGDTNRGVVFECKLKRTYDADVQLRDVYLPLCRHIWPNREWRAVAVCKHWAGSVDGLRICTKLETALLMNEPLVWWHRWS